MKIELIKKEESSESVLNNLKDFPANTLGIIRKWNGLDQHIGQIVILQNGVLYYFEDFVKARFDTNSWPNFEELSEFNSNFIIDVLPKGTEIKITI